MTTGLSFVHSLLVLAGVLAALLGVGLWMAETVPPGQLAGTRRRLGDGLRALGAAPWTRIPGCLTGWLAGMAARMVRAVLAEADTRTAFGGFVLVLMLVLIPGAALLNALVGGRPALFWYYLSLLAVLAVLNFTGETRRFRLFNGLAAAYLGVSVIVVVPFYLIRSFTDVTINNVFSHGVLKSLLVAVFWYVGAYGAGLVFDTGLRLAGREPGRMPWARFVHGFLAAVPAAYVLTFLALLAGHFSVYDQNPARSWQLVLWATAITSLAFPLTLAVMAWGTPGIAQGGARGGAGKNGGGRLLAAYAVGLLVAAGLSVLLAKVAYHTAAHPVGWADAAGQLIGQAPGRPGLYLDPAFWVAHLPFIPVGAFVAVVVVGAIAKAAVGLVGAVAGGEAAGERPFLASALSSAGVALLLWVAALTI